MGKHNSDKCPFRKPDCFAFGIYGRCNACTNTDFNSTECPFYKTATQRYREHHSAVSKLESENRFDLIAKYGEMNEQPRIWREIVNAEAF